MSFVCLFVCLHVSTQVLVYDFFFPFRLALVVVVCLFFGGGGVVCAVSIDYASVLVPRSLWT